MYVDPDPPRANFCFIKLPPRKRGKRRQERYKRDEKCRKLREKKAAQEAI
jgi:hypothetical protein